MAFTVRESAGQGSAPRKRNVASLVGGYIIAVGCFVLWVLCASQLTQWPPSVPVIVVGVVVAVAIGCWIRLADL